MEYDILSVLQFSVHYTSPLIFLERFQRIFGLDMIRTDEESRKSLKSKAQNPPLSLRKKKLTIGCREESKAI